MGALEFVASITSSLVWPAVVITCVFWFRKSLKHWLAERPSRFKAGPIEAEWGRQAAVVEAAVEEEREEPPPTTGYEAMTLPTDLWHLAEASPLTAVTQASGAVEEALRDLLVRNGDTRPPTGMGALVQRARTADLITGRLADSLMGLTVMRNLAVHGGGQLTDQRAREFLALADSILVLLQGAHRRSDQAAAASPDHQ
jgi:hypothetical protein